MVDSDCAASWVPAGSVNPIFLDDDAVAVSLNQRGLPDIVEAVFFKGRNVAPKRRI